MASLQGKTLTVAKREKPSFGAMTAGKAAFGMIGAAPMIAKGNSTYSAKLKLTDTRSGKVLAEGFCARIPEKSTALRV